MLINYFVLGFVVGCDPEGEPEISQFKKPEESLFLLYLDWVSSILIYVKFMYRLYVLIVLFEPS